MSKILDRISYQPQNMLHFVQEFNIFHPTLIKVQQNIFRNLEKNDIKLKTVGDDLAK